MPNVSYIRSGDGFINIFCGGKPFTVSPDAIAYAEIDKALKDGKIDEETILSLLNTKEAIKVVARTYTKDRVDVDIDKNTVTYDGVAFPDKALCDRIIRLMREGHPFEYMVNFLNRLCKNPNFRSVMELFHFISVRGFPITPDGTILCYKGVNEDWTDCHTGKISNRVGAQITRLERPEYDDDWRKDCSKGYHVGTYEYAKSFGPKLVLVEVDPADVISVPTGEVWKMRCCWYKVIADHTNMSMLTGEVYDSEGKAVAATTYGQFDNDTADHWDDSEGRQYGSGDNYDYEDEDDWYEDDF